MTKDTTAKKENVSFGKSRGSFFYLLGCQVTVETKSGHIIHGRISSFAENVMGITGGSIKMRDSSGFESIREGVYIAREHIAMVIERY